MATTEEASRSNEVQEALRNSAKYLPRIEAFRKAGNVITSTDLKLPGKRQGKVRDTYTSEDGKNLVIISTDRQSGFDRHLAVIPFKGSVLNLTSQWWMDRIKEKGIVKHHLLSVPHPNVTVGKVCNVFPVEFVMRGYLTGSTGTSIWKNYEKGCRMYCGHKLPDGLRRNQILPMGNILTPTTKDDKSDELITAEEVVSSGRMSQADWNTCAKASEALFTFGQEEAASRGLLLVDTKYEFGKDPETGDILLVDEIHTPDSSRWWVSESYLRRFQNGQEPEMIDKEILRRWFAQRCDPYKDTTLPTPPAELINTLSRKYIMLYEMITSQRFVFPDASDYRKDGLDTAISQSLKQ